MVGASAAPLAVNGVKMVTKSRVHQQSNAVTETNALMSDLSRQFYDLGLRKGRTVAEDLYGVSPSGSRLSWPISEPNPQKPPKCFDFALPFLKAKCYHYGFDDAINFSPLDLDWSTPNHRPIPNSSGVFSGHQNVNMSVKAASRISSNSKGQTRHYIVLDIEGTTTPISFVTDVLFPYARENVGRHLDLTYDTSETQKDIKLLRSQVYDDLEQGIDGAVPIPSDDVGRQELIAALVTNVQAMIRADRKITALKKLQGHIWRTGFQSSEIKGIVFDDVPEALEKWHASGIKVYIYSSGSRLAQRLIFGNTNHGDLRKYLCGFFDTTIGNKKETSSYVEISESLGVDKPAEILFVTDVYQEAIAAKAAGLEVIISVRAGNGPLPENHGFKTINSFSEI